MKISGLRFHLALVATGAGLLSASVAVGADVAAGKARFNSICAECHDSADFEGEDVNALADTLRRISHGEMKHKKTFTLTDQQIADVAAYMASGGK